MQKFPKPLFLGKGHIEHSESKGVQISVYIHFYEWSSAGGPWGSIGQHMIFVLKE
jgi:hypothetical protein